ncbi:MAG: 3'-5' exonuclease [Clostridium sp.]|nr:3'-5' exonuclease [Clostridium sp.]
MNKFIIFDTETTGLKVEVNQIGQLSYIVLDNELNILKSRNLYFKVKKVEDKASEINGLTVEKLEKLSGGKTFKDHSNEIFEDFNDAKVICHNVKFDMKFLTEEFSRIGVHFEVQDSFCTMLNYKDILKIKHERFGYKFPKLEEVMRYLKVSEKEIKKVLSLITDDKNIGYHDARYDIACTYIAYKYLKSNEGSNKSLSESNKNSATLNNEVSHNKNTFLETIKKYFSFLTKKK